jgi:hypothetical protein
VGKLLLRQFESCNLINERAKGVMAQDKSVLSQITANDEIVKEIFHWMAPVCETRQITIECAAVVSTSIC